MAEKQHQEHGVKLEQEDLCCAVCLDLPTEPVALSCGHSYCRGCIESCWDKEKEKGSYSCPQCRETFDPRPVLWRNNTLAEIVEKMKKTSTQQASTSGARTSADSAGVACDFCSGPKPNIATMSCLTCLASYCPAHLEPHYTVPVLKTHQLVSAIIPLQDNMCTKHSKLLEFYCETDEQLVCSSCTVDEHKGHKTVSASVQKIKTKNDIVLSQKEVQNQVQQRENELKELKQAEENIKTDRIFAELIAAMQERCCEVKQLIVSQESSAVTHAAWLQLQLEEEITKLRRRDTKLEQLLHTDDHIYMIQAAQSLSASRDSQDVLQVASPLRSFTDVTDCVSELRDKVDTVLKETWPRISATVCYVDFSLQPAPNTREEFLRYCCPLTLDVTTNYPYLHLINDNRRVRPSPSPYSAAPDRFTKFPQVLCRERLSKRCYWEVEWYARTLSAAVAYKDISRTSDDSRFGNNDKSWSLECTASGYSYRHNSVETTVSGPSSGKIGVYLDYNAGVLCFYHVSDTMVLLHKVQTTFTQPLHPGLGLNYEWYDVGVFAQLVEL